MIDGKSGNIKFDLFWRRLRNCFDEDDSSDQAKDTHHAMVAFENLKQASKYQSTIDKRTQLTGKAGPEKRKREDDNSEPSADDSRFVTNKKFNDLFSFAGQILKNTNSQKENQGQGRRGDSDRGYNKEREPCRVGADDKGTAKRRVAITTTSSISMRARQLPLEGNPESQN